MKIYFNLLALCALSGNAAAFVQPQLAATSTSLASSYRMGDGNGNPAPRDSDRRGVETRSRSSSQQRRSSPSGRGGALDRERAPPRRERSSSTDRVQKRRNAPSDEQFRPVIVQGGSLETWSFPSPVIERVSVRLETEGRPLNANVELWQGPDNSPQKMGVYLEDGGTRPFNAVIATPRGSNAIAVRNTGMLEFPLTAGVEEDRNSGFWDFNGVPERTRTVQGGAVYTEPFAPGVQSVQLMLRTDGRPLNARVELLQGPNNNKQVMEIYSEDGYERPFLCVLDTPEVGNVIRIVNTATVEFPLSAAMEPFTVEAGYNPENDYGYSNQNRLDGSASSGGYNGRALGQGRPNSR